MEAKLPSVVFATPTYDGRLNVRYVTGLFGAVIGLRSLGHKAAIMFESNLVERARAKLAKGVVESGFDYLFFVDSDIAFEPVSAVKLLKKAIEIDAGILAAPYPRRNKLPIEYPVRPPENSEALELDGKLGVYRAGGAPMGFMVIHRRVIIAVSEGAKCVEDGVPYIFEPMWNEDGKLLGEDLAFCKRAEERGFPSYLMPGLKLIHEGQFGYGGTWPKTPEQIERDERIAKLIGGD